MEVANDEAVEAGDGFEYWKRRCGEMGEKNGRLESVIRRLEVEKAELIEEVCWLRRENELLAERMKWFANRGKEKGADRGGGESLGLCRGTAEDEILRCEKRLAEDEVKDLKGKIMELEAQARVAQTEEGRILTAEQTSFGGLKAEAVEDYTDLNMPIFSDSRGAERAPSSTKDGTPDLNTPYKSPVAPKSRGGTTSSRTDSLEGLAARRKLVYSHEGSSSPRMLPILPAGVKSSDVGIIAISDSDDEENGIRNNPPIHTAVKSVPFGACFDDDDDDDEIFARRLSGRGSLKRQLTEPCSGECCDGNVKSATPKRKRVSNVVVFDSESGDDDDDIPISQLVQKNLSKVTKPTKEPVLNGSRGDEVDTIANDAPRPSATPRRRLIPLSQRRTKGSTPVDRSPSKYDSGVRSSEGDVADNGLEDIELESEGESLGGFIVKSSDSDPNSSNCSTENRCSDENDASIRSTLQSDSDVEYGEIMSKLRRDRDHSKTEWKLEGEMLAAFGKDPRLCMKAVCALYRRQTDDEKQCKGTIHANGRGFNHLDALRGSELAEFLTDGDPYGPVKKSVEELEKYYPDGVELCRHLARKYSKQLFTIYQSKEDPLFLPAA